MSTRQFEGTSGPARADESEDVEGHGARVAGPARADESDDVEGHNMGMMNPSLARDLAGAKERELARQSSRQALLSDAKQAPKKKS
jgi:hypothetical protein